MFKFVVLILAVAACSVSADPKPSVVAAYAAAPVVAPAVVTAQSSQVIQRNYNTLAAPLVAAAPVLKAAPLVAAPPFVKAAPFVAAAPIVRAAPLVASSPFIKAAPLVAAHPALAYSAPFVAAPGLAPAAPYVAAPAHYAHYAAGYYF